MGRHGSGRNAKAVMRLAPERKPRMRLALGCGRHDPTPEPWPRKARMHLVQTGGCTPTKRSDADGAEPQRADGSELRAYEVARSTPRRRYAADSVSPLSSSQGCTPSATASPSPERPESLERLEHPVLTQAAAALAELARSQARAAAAAEALRLEREARSRDEAAHGAERERLQQAADELQMQLAALRREYCDEIRDSRDRFEMERGSASHSQGATDALPNTNTTDALPNTNTTDALRAARAEAQLLPHSEIAERGHVEHAEGEARRRLADSSRTACAAAAAERRGVAGGIAILQSQGGADSPMEGAAHPDAGWFLTLDIIALSVAPFAPRRWAPVCRDTAEAVCNVHKFWHNASNAVMVRMMHALGVDRECPSACEWIEPRFNWTVLIDNIGRTPTHDEDAKRRLCLRARAVSNALERLQLDYQDALETMRCTNFRIQGTRRVMCAILGK